MRSPDVVSRAPSCVVSKSDLSAGCSNLFATVPDLLVTVANPGDNFVGSRAGPGIWREQKARHLPQIGKTSH